MSFINDTKMLRQKYRNIVITMDGYGAHVTYKALKLLGDNNIVVVGLPAHSSHRTQVLDYAVFSPFRTFLRNRLNQRVYTEGAGSLNDIYTLCELIGEAYKSSVSYCNIVNGFKAVGVWCPVRKGVLPDVIKVRDITNIGSHGSGEAAFRRYQELVHAFMESRNLLRSDGPVLVNGTINTRS